MLFSSLIFMFMFLPIVLLVYFGVLIKLPIKVRNRFLLLASLFFYGWGEPIYVLLMVGCICYNYLFGLWVDKARLSENKRSGRTAITLMLVCNLGVLGVFKYADFVIGNLNSLLGLELTLPGIALPIGISFFTFQGISYVIDVYRGHGEVQKNPLDVGLYIAFFPQLIAGPIVRYNTIAKEIKNRRENVNDFADGVSIFIVGLAKKVLLANQFALIADKAFSLAPDSLSIGFAWLGALAYTLQIYFDFGGYSDMAIGLGRMFGFHFLPNFNFPYTSRSVSDFWRRWHMSLGTWFRDYVYFPLGGSRVESKLKLLRNLLVVWFLTGLWHGANWTFIVWGLYYFAFLAFEKLTGIDKKLERLPVISNIIVMLVVIFGWVIFRADTMAQALDYMQAMIGMNGTGFWDAMATFYFNDYRFYLLAGILCALPLRSFALKHLPHSKRNPEETSTAFQVIIMLVLLLLLLTAVSFLAKGSYNPFIYFNF